MRKYLKYLSSVILIPFFHWYLRKERAYEYNGISITVKPGVFHPGFFHSTKFILDYLKKQDLAGRKFLELGCGSGLISVFAAKQRALVVASDISKTAVENTQLNARKNEVDLNAFQSDLFQAHQKQIYDWIVINPPYYAKRPQTEAEYAWYCGENFEYFQALFRELPGYSNTESQIIMILTKGCDLEAIRSISRKNGFVFDLIAEKNVLFDEKDFLFAIKRI